jgi:hypothetical protein
MPTLQGYIRSTCCYPQACDTNCYCNCPDCSYGYCASYSACSAGFCGNCYSYAYDMSWPCVYNQYGGYWCSNCNYNGCFGSWECGSVLYEIWDYYTAKNIFYPEITECGPADACQNDVISEVTSAAWSALGHYNQFGTDDCYVAW